METYHDYIKKKHMVTDFSKFYTGIGSRETPDYIYSLMQALACNLAGKGYTLRSGKAKGADTAFQQGVQDYITQREISTCNCEIYIPWNGFEGGEGLWNAWDIADWPTEAYNMAAKIHPAWDKCSRGAEALHARNICQVLGMDLNTPSKFVVFYAKEYNGIVKGGTATAVNLARSRNIPTFNLYFDETYDRIASYLNSEKIK